MTKAKRSKGLTLGDIVNHITHFKQEMNIRMDGLESRINDFHREFRAHAKGVDDLDFRVQDIEDARLPSRVSRIEKHLGLAKA